MKKVTVKIKNSFKIWGVFSKVITPAMHGKQLFVANVFDDEVNVALNPFSENEFTFAVEMMFYAN